MSLRATGILPHALVDFEQVAQLPTRLESCSDLAIQVAREYWEKPRLEASREWNLTVWGPPGRTAPQDQWTARHGPMIREPEGTSIVFGKHCVCVTTVAKWRVTLGRLALLEAVWDLIAGIGEVIGSEVALLWHDNWGLTRDWVLDGRGLREILHNVKAAGGKPVPHLTELLIPEHAQRPPQAYFVDPLTR